MRMDLRVNVNGVSLVREVEPRRLLSDFLREDLSLTGTHIGCEHGYCGACTVLLDGETVRSCLIFAVQAQGREVTTIEAEEELDPVQDAFSEHHGLQCGFCTPGMIITIRKFLSEVPDPSEQEVREALAGNICRCTGYVQIVASVMAAAKAIREAT